LTGTGGELGQAGEAAGGGGATEAEDPGKAQDPKVGYEKAQDGAIGKSWAVNSKARGDARGGLARLPGRLGRRRLPSRAAADPAAPGGPPAGEVGVAHALMKGRVDHGAHCPGSGATALHLAAAALDEFDYAVTNLRTDLRCGLRLARLAELLTGALLGPQMRLPAISRTQKVHNTEVALAAYRDQGGYHVPAGIGSKDLVDGHREKEDPPHVPSYGINAEISNVNILIP
jgi:hypothetical protein